MFKQFFAYFISFALVYQPVLLRAQIVVDPNAGNQPIVDNGQNGVPIVNIVAPTAGGVSMNNFSEFNVGAEGVVINNSTETGISQLAGAMYNNPLFQGGNTASTIVSYVTGTNQSRLDGFTEIFGSQANYIMANPNGITCAGCGFINTPRVTLTTGDVSANGRMIDVDRGEISIEGAGLNAGGVDYFEIISRTAKLTGQLNGKDVSIIAGRNTYDRATKEITEKADDGSAKPAIAIDASALGSIYAGRIKIVSTEDGVGVQSAGDMIADTADVTLDADGNITYKSITSAGNVNVKSTQDIVQTRRVIAAGDVSLEAKNITIERPDLDPEEGGHLNAGGNISIQMTEDFVNAGDLYALGGSLILSAGNITNDHGTLLSLGDLSLNATGDITNFAGTIQSGGDMTLTAQSFYNIGETTGGYTTELVTFSGGPYVNSDGLTVLNKKEIATSTLGTVAPSYVYSGGNLTINLSDTLHNEGSMLYATNDMTVNARVIENMRSYLDTDPLLTRYKRKQKYTVWVEMTGLFGNWQFEQDKGRLERGEITLEQFYALYPLEEPQGSGGGWGGSSDWSETTFFLTHTDDEYESQRVYSDTPAYILSGGNMILNATDSILNEGSVIKSGGSLDISTTSLQNLSADSGFYEMQYTNYPDPPYWKWRINRLEEVVSTLTSEESIIQSGQDLTITAGEIENRSSDIVSDQNITLNTNNLKNYTSSIETHSLYEKWKYIDKRDHMTGGPTYITSYRYYYRTGETVYSDHVAQIIAGGDLTITDTATQSGDGIQLSNTFYADQNDPNFNGFINVNDLDNIIDPDGILFQYGDGAGYLIESNPLFTDLTGMLESAYWMERLGADPADYEIPFLGDQVYEAELVDRAVRDYTQQRFIVGMNAADQRNILMENALDFAGDLNLAMGIDLTNAQLVQLTKPIIWYVAEEVDLGHGRTEIAYVPKVYFPLAEQAVKTRIGGVLGGNNVMLATNRDVQATGTLHAENNLTITADNFEGRGASLEGGNMTIATTGDFSLSSLIGTASVGENFVTSELSQVAYLGADNLAIQSDGNLDLLGVVGDVTGNANLNAGGDTTVGAVQIHNKFYQKDSETNYTHDETIQNFGSDFLVGGDLALAGKNVNVIGSQMHAGGDVDIDASENLNVIATQDIDYHAFGYATESTFKSEAHQEVHTSITNNLAGISGKNVNLVSGNDTNIIGGEIIADENLDANAGGNINVAGVKDSQYDMVFHQESSFDALGALATMAGASLMEPLGMAGSFDLAMDAEKGSADTRTTYDETVRNSLLSAGNNLSLTSANNATFVSTDLVSDGLTSVNAGGDILVGTMAEEHMSEHNHTEWGGDVVGSVVGGAINAVASTLETQTGGLFDGAQFEDMARQASRAETTDYVRTDTVLQKESNVLTNDLQTVSGNDTAILGSNVIVNQNADIQTGGNLIIAGVQETSSKTERHEEISFDNVDFSNTNSSVSMSVTQQREKSEHTETSSTNKGSTIQIGGNLTANSDQGITVQGSTITADGDVALNAQDDAQVLAGENTYTTSDSYSNISNTLTATVGNQWVATAENAYNTAEGWGELQTQGDVSSTMQTTALALQSVIEAA
ncbi:MAG: hemagglutinin repeat-containing protein, partial [Alphaproteobacteria bacterium]|nr:hemagglutinin repeat-containing protein [Alphaproteobacteria bacterium]